MASRPKTINVEFRVGVSNTPALTLRSGESLLKKQRNSLPDEISARLKDTQLRVGDDQAILTTDLEVRHGDVTITPDKKGGRVTLELRPSPTKSVLSSPDYKSIGSIVVRGKK